MTFYSAVPVSGFPDYLVTTVGEVISLKKGMHIMRPSSHGKGYPGVALHIDAKPYPRLVHRLVAEAFIPNPDGLSTVDHINNIKTDNRVENLRWMSRAENSSRQKKHRLPIGVYRNKYGKFYAQKSICGKVHTANKFKTPEAASGWYQSFGKAD